MGTLIPLIFISQFSIAWSYVPAKVSLLCCLTILISVINFIPGHLGDDAIVQATVELVRRGGGHRGRDLLYGRGVAAERRRL